MSGHTPTPWVNLPLGPYTDIIDLATGRSICIVEKPDDAAFMVLAVNVHADLLAALQAILPWHDSHPERQTDNKIINHCRAAIAKATQSPQPATKRGNE